MCKAYLRAVKKDFVDRPHDRRLRHLRGDADSRDFPPLGEHGRYRQHAWIWHKVLHKIIIATAKVWPHRNLFDCVSPRAVRSGRWALGSIAMFEAVTAFFGVMSAGIFIAHAVDGYRSRA